MKNLFPLDDETLRLLTEKNRMIAIDEDPPRHDVLEKHLVNAVFARAMMDALAVTHGKDWQKSRRLARIWFESDETTDPETRRGWSFMDVVDILDLDAAKIRAFLALHASWDTVKKDDEAISPIRSLVCGQYGIS